MRKLLYILLITCCFSTTYAQFPDSLQHDTASANADLNIIHKPLWKFWMAFEDATGAKDTVWIVFDPRASAYSFSDSIFGEIENPIDSNNFWTRFYYGSHPYSIFAFGDYGFNTYGFGDGIFSDNYVLPIYMTWDSTLLTEHYTPGGFQYATLYNDYIHYTYPSPGFDQELDMTTRSFLKLPSFTWGSQNHFPLDFSINSSTLGIEFYNEKPFKIFPNPADEIINIYFFEAFGKCEINIINPLTNRNLRILTNDSHMEISLSNIPSGLVIIEIRNLETNTTYYEKIIKH